jgi:hypothetical protein
MAVVAAEHSGKARLPSPQNGRVVALTFLTGE